MLKVLLKVATVTTLLSSSLLFAQDMSLQELSKYNGKDGNKAYIAVDGTIYNVSDYSKWRHGEHAYGKIKAGSDASEYIDQSPHGRSKLAKLPVVGKLIQ